VRRLIRLGLPTDGPHDCSTPDRHVRYQPFWA
jgi:hypothetical protein